jgi:plasmid stability protein
MKNLTISLNDDLHQQSRVRAARAGLSMSRYVASLVEKDVQGEPPDTEEDRRKRLEMLERFLSGPKLHISENGRMPTAEERNARR